MLQKFHNECLSSARQGKGGSTVPSALRNGLGLVAILLKRETEIALSFKKMTTLII